VTDHDAGERCAVRVDAFATVLEFAAA